jgi:hypothetical protein
MKRFIAMTGFLLFYLFLLGQENTGIPGFAIRGDPGQLLNPYPDVFVKIDTCKIKLDSLTIKLIDPNWIKKIEVIKSEKYKEVFGNKDGTIMIYIKKKYNKNIRDRLKIPK